MSESGSYRLDIDSTSDQSRGARPRKILESRFRVTGRSDGRDPDGSPPVGITKGLSMAGLKQETIRVGRRKVTAGHVLG
jgi:hypothetical protein